MSQSVCAINSAIVTQIAPHDVTDVYDISVDGTHCFFANGVLVHNCHHAVAGQWATITAAWPNARILGVTATPIRLDGRGLGAAFDCLVIGPTMRQLIQGGYLARYDYLSPPQKHDISAVKSGRFGDYSVEELAAVMDKSVITGDAVLTYSQHLDGRPAIAFCVSIQHAEHVADEFRAAGYRAASVDGTMDNATRADLIASIGDGRLNILTSCQIISEGTDIPSVAGAILLRPTKSLSMYLQSVGRCLRPKLDGSRALIIDHAGNAHIHGMPCDEREWTLANTKRISKSKSGSVSQCEVCYRAFGVSPGWREQAQCGADRPDGCCLRAAEPQPSDINQVAGDLVLTTADEIAAVAPRQLSFKQVMQTARTRTDLERIAAERGYKPGWVDHAAKAYHVRIS